MDPDVCLAELKESLAVLREKGLDPNRRAAAEERALERVEALDGWLSKGGYWPEAWSGFLDKGLVMRNPQ